MCKLHSFTIYIQTLSVTALEILSTLKVVGRALCFLLPKCLWLYYLGTGHPGPYIDHPFSLFSLQPTNIFLISSTQSNHITLLGM